MDVPALSLPGLQDIRQPPHAIQLDTVPVEQLHTVCIFLILKCDIKIVLHFVLLTYTVLHKQYNRAEREADAS